MQRIYGIENNSGGFRARNQGKHAKPWEGFLDTRERSRVTIPLSQYAIDLAKAITLASAREIGHDADTDPTMADTIRDSIQFVQENGIILPRRENLPDHSLSAATISIPVGFIGGMLDATIRQYHEEWRAAPGNLERIETYLANRHRLLPPERA